MQIQMTAEQLAAKKLFVGTPQYGGMNAGIFGKSMCDLTSLSTRYNVPLQFFCLFNESLITRARNYCVDEFLRSEMNHLLFLDADIGFDPNDVFVMLGMQTEDSPYDIICAPYPKKCISWEKIKQAVDKGIADENPNELENYVGDYVFNPVPGQQNIPISEPVEILEGGTGFMMIKRSALEKFRDAYPQYNYRPDHIRTAAFDGSREIMQFFQAEIDRYDAEGDYANLLTEIRGMALGQTENGGVSGVVNGSEIVQKIDEVFTKVKNLREKDTKRYLSEDYWFSQKARKIGLKVWLCPWMKTMHMGSYMFGGSLAHLASIGASPTADAKQLKGKK